jgi:hypothetical protein
MKSLIILLVVFALQNFVNTFNAQEMRSRPSFEKGTLISSTSGKMNDDDYFASSKRGDFNVVAVWSGNMSVRREDVFQTTGVVVCIVTKEKGVQIKKGTKLMSDGKGCVMPWEEGFYPIGYAVEDWSGTSSYINVRLSL